MRKKRIFITGGCGFIGANLVRYLSDKGGYDITAYDNLFVGSKSNLDRAIKDARRKSKVKFIKGDILDKNKIFKITKGYDAIAHLAAHTSVLESIKNPTFDFHVNVVGTFNVLEAARHNSIKCFIFASSNAVLGQQRPPVHEEMIPRPISVYGANKLAAESLCLTYGRSFGIKTIILRFANCYGPYSEHKTSVIAKFIKAIKAGKPIYIYGDGGQTRDFIHSQDVCRAVYLCIEANNDIAGEIFQIGTQTETRIKYLAQLIYKIGRRQPKIIYRLSRKGEIKKNYACIRKAKDLLEFKPKINLNNGLKNLWHWFSENE